MESIYLGCATAVFIRVVVVLLTSLATLSVFGARKSLVDIIVAEGCKLEMLVMAVERSFLSAYLCVNRRDDLAVR